MPGFDDGVRVATAVLQWVGGVVVIAAGLAVPFLWLIPVLALLWWWRRRRKAASTAADTESEDALQGAALESPDDVAPASTEDATEDAAPVASDE